MTDTIELPLRLFPLADLKLDEHNARVHSRRNLDTIKASLRRGSRSRRTSCSPRT